MSDYDFQALNDKEFEVLSIDMLSERDGVRYERFKPGRDAGVDGRYYHADGTESVIQCKHWARSPLEKLIAYLELHEAPKARKLAPSRYILVVSHSLGRADKKRIAEIFDPLIRSPSDVLGREDLNSLLAQHPTIERRHYKLWIASAGVLGYVLNKSMHDRSVFVLEEILSRAHMYVEAISHNLALAKLGELGSVIITGPAGIGKTTLAEHLVLHYCGNGYSLACVADEIREAESVFEENISKSSILMTSLDATT